MNSTYWALSLFSVDLHEDQMTGFFLSGAVEIPAGVAAMVLLLYFGRRTVTFFSLFLTSVSMFVAVLLPGKTYLTMTFPLLAKVFNSMAWCSEPLLVGEMAPTSVRNVFYGSVGFMGEIGSILAPYLNILKNVHESAPPLLISIMSLVAALAVLCSPETKDKSMPQDIPDFDSGSVYKALSAFFTRICGSKTPEKAANGKVMAEQGSTNKLTTNEADKARLIEEKPDNIGNDQKMDESNPV